MQEVIVHGRVFEPYLTEETIEQAVSNIADQLNQDYKNQKIIFVAVLNGSFMFCSDLLKKIKLDCEISFVKLTSYEGTSSTGKVQELIGLQQDVSETHVVLVEDIVDTGNTLEKLHEIFEGKNLASLKIATLLYKPSAYKKNLPIDYIGKEIPNEFVLGYGLDYDGLGRNLASIYKLKA